MNQMTIDQAIAAGNCGMEQAASKAQALGFDTEGARAAILAHLHVVGRCSGEVLVDVAKAHGHRPSDDRAFGSVFFSLVKRRHIFVVGYAPRTKGHGCMGAKIYAIQH